jgi:hypothetical protein
MYMLKQIESLHSSSRILSCILNTETLWDEIAEIGEPIHSESWLERFDYQVVVLELGEYLILQVGKMDRILQSYWISLERISILTISDKYPTQPQTCCSDASFIGMSSSAKAFVATKVTWYSSFDTYGKLNVECCPRLVILNSQATLWCSCNST